MMEKRRLIPIILIILLLIGGFAYYFYKNSLQAALTASGTIEATDVTVSSKVVAKALEVKVDEGSQVKQGDTLAVLDPSELQQALNGARAKYQIAKDDFARNRQLFADKMISPQQYDASSSALDVAKATLDTAQLQLDNATIKAPISGVILVKAIEPGELATVGTPIVTMADLSAVKLIVYLAENNVGKVNLGEEVAVSVDSYPGEKFMGKITYISDQAEFTPKSIQTKEERTTQVFGIKIEIPNPELKLKPGCRPTRNSNGLRDRDQKPHQKIQRSHRCRRSQPLDPPRGDIRPGGPGWSGEDHNPPDAVDRHGADRRGDQGPRIAQYVRGGEDPRSHRLHAPAVQPLR